MCLCQVVVPSSLQTSRVLWVLALGLTAAQWLALLPQSCKYGFSCRELLSDVLLWGSVFIVVLTPGINSNLHQNWEKLYHVLYQCNFFFLVEI